MASRTGQCQAQLYREAKGRRWYRPCMEVAVWEDLDGRARCQGCHERYESARLRIRETIKAMRRGVVHDRA